MELVAALGRGDKLETLAEAGAQVAVDLTTPRAVMEQPGLPAWPTGSTPSWARPGSIEARLGTLRGWVEQARRRPASGVLIAPNFCIGAC